MTTSTELVPVSTYQYPQAKYQAWLPDTSQIPLVSNSNLNSNSNTAETESGSCKKHLTTKLFMSILIGLIICGVPLAVISSLYVQKQASANNNSGSSGSSSSNNLPTQCTSYYSNTDPTRLTTFTSCTSCFYDTSTYFPAGWYRFTDTGGTRLATVPPSSNTCGAVWPAWYNGTYPSTAGTTISSTMCVHISGTLCHPSYPITISVTNCNGYYVFYLPSATTSNIRYCTTF